MRLFHSMWASLCPSICHRHSPWSSGIYTATRSFPARVTSCHGNCCHSASATAATPAAASCGWAGSVTRATHAEHGGPPSVYVWHWAHATAFRQAGPQCGGDGRGSCTQLTSDELLQFVNARVLVVMDPPGGGDNVEHMSPYTQTT